ncbi:hypothetical protein DENIS_3061 [Desulfonema ishimotonii]|uniref:Uncharacterized protein n=1 Tax=Desulfonema ishimotonii TaxID=45657 RepID=A0A401FYQ1_9BACT|nr:hypothetical protein DENIS_3061 [Desulfonema ishimotonii]
MEYIFVQKVGHTRKNQRREQGMQQTMSEAVLKIPATQKRSAKIKAEGRFFTNFAKDRPFRSLRSCFKNTGDSETECEN